ncbi:IPT/TIG domain-containing protein [Flavobacterium sp.]|uniref:IPT/TIG domain-containing protein n=1 Tax=Flavobacterium sp. TaxID=239 RepID=UPI0026155AA4|nr:IPT/TIG domain-containing protein [Flavobacterium sp.]
MKTIVKSIIILGALLVIFTSCSSSDSPAPTPIPTSPTITSFSPQTGGYSSTLTITGTNFSATPANNKVTINGVEATVTAATATQLTVTVPACGGTGNVKVMVGNNTATSSSSFSYTPDVYVVGYESNGTKNVAKL